MRDETLLAFDFGLKRIGVAAGNVRLGQARALACIDSAASEARFAAIGRLVAEWQPARLLVGRPLNDDGTAHGMTARCARFANQLRGRFQLPVEEVDERFSSIEADAALRDSPYYERRLSWQERKARVDAEAARVILQSWLATHVHEAA